MLRAEGAAVLLASLYGFHCTGARVSLFAALFFAPDLSFLAWLVNGDAATAIYNTLHSYVLPVALLCVGIKHAEVLPYALIWTAHIGFDRSLGYGLKYRSGFGHTHLGVVGKART